MTARSCLRICWGLDGIKVIHIFLFVCFSFDRNISMNNIYPLSLLYDGLCPVCSLEMDHLRARDSNGQLVFINIAAPGFEASAWGTTQAELCAEIHGVTPDGQHLLGLAALRAAYDAAGLGWVLRPTGWGPLAPLADAGYRLFARYRRPISAAAAPLIHATRAWRERRRDERARRVHRDMARCQGGQCEVRAQGE
jgi:predicted DCC family thiol-disulfide oxidoreductase YuxK